MRVSGAVRTVPPPGQVLVSNWQWEPSSELGSFVDHDHAQEFTTGSHSLGYTLTSVELHLRVPSHNLVNLRNRLGVSIHASSGGVPGTRLATLTKPITIRDGFNKYTHAGLDLSPSTSYFVVMDISSLTSAGVKNTVSDGETGAAGWTIGNTSLYRTYHDSTDPWETSSQTKRLRIRGEPKREPLSFPSDCSAAAITPGLYRGALTGDCPSLVRDQGVNARHVSFSLAERQQVTLTLESEDFDTYLYLGSGKAPATADWTHQNDNIGYDDLGIGYSTDSRLSVTLDAGNYLAELTSLEANETGSFNLTLETSAPAPTSDPEPGPLPAPTGLVVTTSFVDEGRITIAADWKPVKGADFYRVRLTDGSGGQYTVKLSHGSSWGFFEAPGNIIRPGTTYTVEVSANDGPNKATATVTTLNRPTGLILTTVADNAEALDVSWDPVPNGYNYYVDYRTPPGSGSFVGRRTFGGNQRNTQITGLVHGTEYEVRVSYRGSTPFCDPCPAATARGTTKSLVVGEIEINEVFPSRTNDGILTLDWQAVPGTSHYRVEYKQSTAQTTPFTVNGTYSASTIQRHPTRDTPQVSVGGLDPGTTYTVRVTALRSGRSLGSGEAVGTTREAFGGVQARPVVNHGDGLTVSWTALDGDYEYRVDYKRTGSSDSATRVFAEASPLLITGLTPNAEYTIEVQARTVLTRDPNTGGVLDTAAASRTITVTGTTSPLSIQGVEVKTDYTNEAQLTVFWEDDSRAGRYRVEYRKGTDLNPYDPDGSTELDGSVTPSPPQFTVAATNSRSNHAKDSSSGKLAHLITGLEAGTAYTVRVVALEGASGDKEMGSGQNVGKTRDPFGPITVNPIQGEADELDVWWTAIPHDDIQYVVEYRTWLLPDGSGINTGDFTPVTRTDPKASSERISGLTEDTVYTVQVTARHNNSDIGQASGSGTPGTADGSEVPQPLPTTLTVAVDSVPDNNTQLRASWNGVRDATKYHVSWQKGISGGWSDAVETTDTDHTITVPKRVMYTVRVVATDANGYWLAEDEATYYPAEIQMLSASPGTDRQSQVNLFWDAVTGATRYRVNWKASPDDGGADWVNANVTPSYAISGLTPGGEYAITVVALDGDSDVLALGEIVVTTAAAGNAVQPEPPQKPVGTAALENLSVSSVSGQSTQLAVSWDEVQGAARYDVRWKTGAGDYGDAQQATTNSYTVTGLTANTTYTVNVAALDRDNSLLAEGTASGTTEPATGQASTQSAALAGLTVNPVASETTKLALSWNAVPDADEYLVQWKTGDADYNSGDTVTTNSHTITGLTAGTTYTVKVTAIDTDADPDAELAVGEASGTTLAAMGAVTVAAVADSSDSLDVSWPSVSRAVGYLVEYKTGDGSYTAVTRSDATATSERITGLDAETTYTIRVTARHTIAGLEANGDSAEGSGTTNAAPSEEAPANTPATGAPSISGTAQVGETLTAATSGITDADGLTNVTFSYQWLADGSDISGATGSSYTLVAGDAGKAISVRVSFTDDSGNAETLTSAATAAVAAEDPPEEESSVSFVIYHDPDAGDAAVDRYNQGVKLLKDAGISYSEVKGDVQDDVDNLAGVTGSVLPRFFLGDPTEEGWVSETKVNNGGLRWLKEKMAELSEG